MTFSMFSYLQYWAIHFRLYCSILSTGYGFLTPIFIPYGFLTPFLAVFPGFFEIGRLLDSKSEIGQSYAAVYWVQGGENAQDAIRCKSLFAKESLIIGLFSGKYYSKIRYPMGLCHPIASRHLRMSVTKVAYFCTCFRTCFCTCFRTGCIRYYSTFSAELFIFDISTLSNELLFENVYTESRVFPHVFPHVFSHEFSHVFSHVIFSIL